MNLIKNNTSVWKKLKNADCPIILYGMGDGADKVLAAFEKFGIKASGVMASDEFVRGQSFHGFTVKKLDDFEKEYKSFVVALCFASSLDEVMNTINNVAKRHTTLVPSVPVFGSVLFDEEFLNENAKEIEFARSLFADSQSVKVYESILNFYFTGQLELLDAVTSDKAEAFENILKLSQNESYVDIGAYNGDTIQEFLHYTNGKYKRITALEPNAKNFKKLQQNCEHLKNIDLWQLGAYSKNTVVEFNNKAGRNSAMAQNGVKTQVAAVDSILCGMAPGYIKADVEGADRETLLGMKNTLKMFRPKLNFSAYHRFEDIFRLPILINSINPEYKIYLRHHPYIPAWDTNLYCI